MAAGRSILLSFIIGRGGGGNKYILLFYYPLNILNNFSVSNLIPDIFSFQLLV
jgi:hypothetical protein